MDLGLTEAAETVEAVLQGVLDDTQQWAALETDIREATSVYQQTRSKISPGFQQAGNADQSPLAGSASPQLSAPCAVTVPDALSHMPPVLSAINPLFLAAQPRRPQSAQLQQTLSAMCDQLAALEDSMQPEEGAAGTPARPLPAHPSEVTATADLSQQQGVLSDVSLMSDVSTSFGERCQLMQSPY